MHAEDRAEDGHKQYVRPNIASIHTVLSCNMILILVISTLWHTNSTSHCKGVSFCMWCIVVKKEPYIWVHSLFTFCYIMCYLFTWHFDQMWMRGKVLCE